MQISRSLLKNTRASLRIHKRLFVVFVIALLLVVIFLVLYTGFPQVSVALGPSASPTSSSPTPLLGQDISGGSSVGGGDPTTTPTDTPTMTPTTTDPVPTPLATPEYGYFAGGSIIALLICFAAFGTFAKKMKPSAN